MSDNASMTFEPPLAWTVEAGAHGPGRVSLKFFRGDFPPQSDAAPLLSLEIPALDAQKIGRDLLKVADQV